MTSFLALVILATLANAVSADAEPTKSNDEEQWWMWLIVGLTYASTLSAVPVFFLTLHIRKKKAQKRVKQQYAALKGTEKDTLSQKVAEMEESIANTLTTENFGTDKCFDAWKAWSRPDRIGLRTLKKKGVERDYVLNAMYCAEQAMRAEEKAEKELEKKISKTEEATHLAALMWAIYWPEKVEKAKKKQAKKQAKKSGRLFPAFDSPV